MKEMRNADKEKINVREDLRDPEGTDLYDNPDFVNQDDFGANRFRMHDMGAIAGDVPLKPQDPDSPHANPNSIDEDNPLQ